MVVNEVRTDLGNMECTGNTDTACQGLTPRKACLCTYASGVIPAPSAKLSPQLHYAAVAHQYIQVDTFGAMPKQRQLLI